MKQRIQKVIAAQGNTSRREVERLIDQGLVRVNGVTLRQKGFLVDPAKDRIWIKGRAFHYKPHARVEVILFNKPRHVVVTRADPEGKQTVYDLLPETFATLKPVGRLDYASQGALILTNDGELINRLTHPRYHLEKIYQVKVTPHPQNRQLRRLSQGIVIDGVRTLPAVITVAAKHTTSTTLKFVLTEGRNRQIRKMCDAVRLTVKEIRRVAIGPIRLGGLRSGQFRALTPQEIQRLKMATRQD